MERWNGGMNFFLAPFVRLLSGSSTKAEECIIPCIGSRK